jgi:tetratricopeptide (TPR) repeat protein
MNTVRQIFILPIAAAMFSTAAIAAQQGHTRSTEATQQRHFSSDIGFMLTYPAEWNAMDLGSAFPASKPALDPRYANDPYRRAIECAQKIFFDRAGEPQSIFLGGVITNECLGAKPDLDAFIARTMTMINGRYHLSGTRYAAFSVEGQYFWALQATGVDRKDAGDVETIEYLAAVLPKGLVYLSAQSRDARAQSGFEHARLHLSNGVETDLIPEGVFDKTAPANAEFTKLTPRSAMAQFFQLDKTASHHFQSDLGFSYEIPSDFRIFDPEDWEAKHHLDANGQPVPDRLSESSQLKTLLAAGSEDLSQIVVVTSCTGQCKVSLEDAHNLQLLLAADVVGLAKNYTLRDPSYGAYSIGSRPVAVMRSAAASKSQPWEPEAQLALLIAPVPGGIIEYFLKARTSAGLGALMATRIQFADGAASELIPASAFNISQASEPVNSAVLPADSAQPPPPASVPAQSAPAAKDAIEPVVVEQFDHVYTMAADGTGTVLFTIAASVNSEAAVRQLGLINLPFASASGHFELVYVRVRRPDGTVTETPVDQAIEMPSAVTTSAPFYSDLKELQLPVRNLRVGDRLEYQARLVITKPEVPGQFWGAENFIKDTVTRSQIIELHVPKDIYINVWSPSLKPAESTTATEHIYRWETSNTKPTVGPEAESEKERDKKHLWSDAEELDETEGKLPSVAWTTFKSWDALGTWYRSLIASRILPVSPEVQAKVDELTAGKTTQEEKLRAVYQYVASQIRYVGVAFGIGRFQPHAAVDVLENQYGDCKDKHTLLASMISAIGLHPETVLIGGGVRFNPDVPSPESFNHVITRVEVDGKPIWLDATTEVAPYRALLFELRDKSALVIPEQGAITVERTPVDLPFAAIDKMDSVGTLDETGISNSHIVLVMRGDSEIIIRNAFHEVPAGQYDQLAQKFSFGIGYGGTTSNADISRPEDTAEPFRLSYDYKREKAGDWDHHRTVAQLMPASLPRISDQDPPTHFIELGAPRTELSTSAMKLPHGWRATLPDAKHVKSPWATFDESYRFENGTVYGRRELVVLAKNVPRVDWKEYKRFSDQADFGNEPFIQLTPAFDSFVPSMPALSASNVSPPILSVPSSNNPSAAKLIAASRTSIQHRDFETARSQLDQARADNPEQILLWVNYGYLEFQQGNFSAAINDYNKELALHPENYGTYSSLASAQNLLGQEVDAEHTLRRWAAAQPDSTAPIVALNSLLIEADRPLEAISAVEESISHLPEMRQGDEQLQFLLGRSQLAAGMKEKGEATLVALLNRTSSPNIMNDSAYQLAKAGLDLTLIESKTREAIESATSESRDWGLPDNRQGYLTKTQQLIASWDTLGWILFREGKIDEADTWIRPVWISRQSPEIGSHMAAIEEAKGNQVEALHDLNLALAAFPVYQRPGIRKKPSATQKALLDHIDALHKAGIQEPDEDSDAALQQLRTVSLGSSGALSGRTLYRLLLSHGTVIDLEKLSGDDVPEMRERVKSARLSALWPTGSEAQLVLNATAQCVAGGLCQLILEP